CSVPPPGSCSRRGRVHPLGEGGGTPPKEPTVLRRIPICLGGAFAMLLIAGCQSTHHRANAPPPPPDDETDDQMGKDGDDDTRQPQSGKDEDLADELAREQAKAKADAQARI